MSQRGRLLVSGAAMVLAMSVGSGVSATAAPEDPAGPTPPVGSVGATGTAVGSFADVPAGAPFFAEVTWLAEAGIAAGYSDGTFRPTAPVTRQAMAAFLYRMVGEPAFEAPAEANFSDVPVGAPFFAQVEWLADSGITAGYSDGTFRPTAPVTRQAMAAFLYRMVGEPVFEAPGEATFSDVPVGAPFFAQVEWLAQTGITAGYEDGTFRPTAPVTRQAMAAFLVRATPYLGRGFQDVAAGWFHTLAVTAGGQVLSWGRNDKGQLGDGTTTSRTSPAPVPGLSGVVTVEGSISRSVALTETGEVYTWGGAAVGQSSDWSLRATPEIVPGLADAVAIDAGLDFFVALTEAGRVVTWGGNQYGQLGDGTLEPSPTPTIVPDLTDVVAIAAGDLHVVALTSDGRVVTWGWNQVGMIGDGTTTNRPSPVLLPAPTDVVQISAGTWQSFAVTADGTGWGWGDNFYRQLANFPPVNEAHSPVVVANLTGVTALEGGVWHTLGLTSDGRFHAWGSNEYGQVGVAPTPIEGRPVALDLPTVDAMAGGWGHTAVLTNGRILTWGRNADGQLGDGTLVDRAWAGPFVTLGG